MTRLIPPQPHKPGAPMLSRWLAAGCLGLWASACLAASPPAETVTVNGKAVTLDEALRPEGVTIDPEPANMQVVIVGEDGAITPLLSDDASRALFRDERLRGRKVEIHGRRRGGSPFVRVVTFKVEDEGELRTPEYFCEICNISVRSPQICPCCQGPMDLRMKPEAP